MKDLEKVALGTMVVMLIYVTVFPLTTDPLLNTIHTNNNEPYGVLWSVLNPAYWNLTFYMVWLFALQVPILALQFKLMQMGKISKKMFYLSFGMTIWWRMMGLPQNVTVTMFAPFAEINPVFTLLLLLQKIPIFWSWNLSDAHWNCAFSNNVTPGCISLAQKLTPTLVLLGYSLLAFWTVYPIVTWWTRRRQK